MGKKNSVHVLGKELALTKQILDSVGQKNGPPVRMRIARMMIRVEEIQKQYDYAVKPGERFIEFATKRRGIYGQYGEMKSNGIEITPEYADAFHAAMAELKEQYKGDISEEYDRALGLQKVDDSENDLGILKASISPAWVKDCDTSHIAFLISKGFVDEGEFDSYLEANRVEE